MNPADLNDPATAEAFVRETIDMLAGQIAEIESDAEKKIQGYRERFADHPSLLLELTLSVQEEKRLRTEPMKQHRNRLLEVIERVEAITRDSEQVILGGPLGSTNAFSD